MYGSCSFELSLFGHSVDVGSVVVEGIVGVAEVDCGGLNTEGEFGTFEVARSLAADVERAEEGIVGRGFEGANDFGDDGRHCYSKIISFTQILFIGKQQISNIVTNHSSNDSYFPNSNQIKRNKIVSN